MLTIIATIWNISHHDKIEIKIGFKSNSHLNEAMDQISNDNSLQSTEFYFNTKMRYKGDLTCQHCPLDLMMLMPLLFFFNIKF